MTLRALKGYWSLIRRRRVAITQMPKVASFRINELEAPISEVTHAVLKRLSPGYGRTPEPEKPVVLDVAPPTIRQNRARQAAYNRDGDSVEEISLQEDARYSETLDRREGMKFAMDVTPAGVLSWESEFNREETVRHDAAKNLLRRGYPVLQTSIATGLRPDEVRDLKEQI